MYEDSDEDEESESSQQSESESEYNEDDDSEFTNPFPAQRVKVILRSSSSDFFIKFFQSSLKRAYRPRNNCSDRICKLPVINSRNEYSKSSQISFSF